MGLVQDFSNINAAYLSQFVLGHQHMPISVSRVIIGLGYESLTIPSQCHGCWRPVAYFTNKVNQSLAKPPLKWLNLG